MTDDEKRALNIPLKAEGVFIHIEDEPPEPKTAGWTDTQIRSKSMSELDAMVGSGEKGLESLRATLKSEEDRIDGLRRIRQRRLDLGG